jgi:hypothetical protein
MRKLTAMRKLLALAAVLTASALNLAAVPASASPRTASAVHPSAITPDTGFTNVQLCITDPADTLCMSGHDGTGGTITGSGSPDAQQGDVDVVVASDECDDTGTVEYKPNANPPVFCPFTSHLIDNMHKGQSIVQIENVANSMVYRTSDDSSVIESPTGDGQLWVQDGDLGGSNPQAVLINVKASNDDVGGFGEMVCAEETASGQPAPLTLEAITLTDPPGDTCEWQAGK